MRRVVFVVGFYMYISTDMGMQRLVMCHKAKRSQAKVAGARSRDAQRPRHGLRSSEQSGYVTSK